MSYNPIDHQQILRTLGGIGHERTGYMTVRTAERTLAENLGTTVDIGVLGAQILEEQGHRPLVYVGTFTDTTDITKVNFTCSPVYTNGGLNLVGFRKKSGFFCPTVHGENIADITRQVNERGHYSKEIIRAGIVDLSKSPHEWREGNDANFLWWYLTQKTIPISKN